MIGRKGKKKLEGSNSVKLYKWVCSDWIERTRNESKNILFKIQ